ncbi:MAG: hypothetical protein M3Q71_21790 [Chloroflexota bacterium]|nr:hypothetical protein [Chloroflexota bacterium]
MATEIFDPFPSSDAALQRGLTPDVIPADRQAAYELWAYVHGQNAAETARALGLSENTVRSWAARDGWRGRLDLERIEQSQRVRSVVDAALIRIVPRVIERLERIAMGEGDIKPVVLKDGSVVEVKQFIPPQASVNACNSLLDRFGLTAVRLHQHQLAPAPSAPTPPASTDHDTTATPTTPLTRERAAAMTPEERQQWERARWQRQAG